jgi:hypothetical protein
MRHLFWLSTLLAADAPSKALWFVSAGAMSLTPAVLIWSLVGRLGRPSLASLASYTVYHFGVVACLLSAVNSFVGFLRLDRPAA